jgi:branched-chain amino acid aminotransferase
MAKIEGRVAGADEVLMLDASGHVCEGSGQNLFIVNGKALRTPPPYAGILLGVTRNAVMEIAAQAGYTVQETLFNRYDIYTADEAFLTGTRERSRTDSLARWPRDRHRQAGARHP